jgi:hypothetical protein
MLCQPILEIGDPNDSDKSLLKHTEISLKLTNTLIQLLNDWQSQNLIEPIVPNQPLDSNYLSLLES